MKRNSKLAASLHALVHMAQAPERAMTSDRIAGWLNTNPVVVRRMIAGLREAGILSATRGPGGGLMLARPASAITLADVVEALGERLAAFGGEAESPGCLVEAAVNAVLDDTRDDIERLLMARMSTVSLADLAARCGPGVVTHMEKMHGH